jgi:uncharacterized protein (DUF305 family)
MTLRAKTLAAIGCAFAVAATVGMATAQNGPLAFAELMAAHDKMMLGMTEHKATTGNPDHDFVMMMIPHHQGAVDMAEVVLKYGSDPEIRALAEAIIKAQKEEITMMRLWMQEKAGHDGH